MAASTFEILVSVAHIAFSFWPLLLLSPLGAKKNQGRLLPQILVMWGAAAILRAMMLFAEKPIPSILIPEPLNTGLFLLAGIGLAALHIGHTQR